METSWQLPLWYPLRYEIIIPFVCLSTITKIIHQNRFGDEHAAAIHLKGLKTMIDLRGGLPSLSFREQRRTLFRVFSHPARSAQVKLGDVRKNSGYILQTPCICHRVHDNEKLVQGVRRMRRIHHVPPCLHQYLPLPSQSIRRDLLPSPNTTILPLVDPTPPPPLLPAPKHIPRSPSSKGLRTLCMRLDPAHNAVFAPAFVLRNNALPG
jgi:hypothetical protein